MSVTGQQIVDAARQLLSAPYRTWTWGAPIPMWLYDGMGDPPPASHLLSYGVECSDLVNWALEVNGLPPGYGTEAFYNYLIEYEDFDPSKPQPPGAIAFRPYSGPALADQGHIAIYSGDGQGGMGTQLIQSITEGVTEYYDAATTYGWGGSTSFWYIAKLPNVDYTGGKPTPKPKDTVFSVDHLLSVYTSMDRSYAQELFPYMVAAFKEFEINSASRIACFLAQAVGEVGEFQYWSELDEGGGRFGQFWGRGPMQLTWREGYERATEYYQAHHSSDVSFVDDPDLVATPKYGFWAGAWFWKYGTIDNLNELADAGNFSLIMERCYGGPHPGNEDLRWEYYNWALSHLPDNLTLEDAPTPEPEDEIVYDKYVLVASASSDEDVAYADAAKMVLDAEGIGNQVFDEPENIQAVGNAALNGGPVCIIVGPEVSGDIPEGKSPNFFRVYVNDTSEPEEVSTLRGMREVLLPWFQEKHNVGKLVDRFDAILMALDTKYAELIARSERDGPTPKPPPEPATPVANWAGFGKDGVLRMGGDWSDGYIIWPDPTKNNRPYWVEYIADRQEA